MRNIEHIRKFNFLQTLSYHDQIIIFSAIDNLDEIYIFMLYDELSNNVDTYLGTYISKQNYNRLITGKLDYKEAMLIDKNHKYHEVYFDEEGLILTVAIFDELTEDDLPGDGIFLKLKNEKSI
jgi:hypothetical protein